jgi:TM2 domain-containing membrane protein YozV
MSARPRNKTVAVWLAALFGSLGIHRFYLRGLFDWIGWLHPIAAALGWWGVERVKLYGQDDKLSWVLIPFLGASIAVGCLVAIVYALTDTEKWNGWFNADHDPATTAGNTNWMTIAALVFSLLLGTIAFTGSLAFVFQHYFEYQVEEARKISQ